MNFNDPQFQNVTYDKTRMETCVAGGTLPNRMNGSISGFNMHSVGTYDETLRCHEPEYSDSGVWCGLVRFASDDCSDKPIWQRFDLKVDECTVELEGTYWQMLKSDGTSLSFIHRCWDPSCTTNCEDLALPSPPIANESLDTPLETCVNLATVGDTYAKLAARGNSVTPSQAAWLAGAIGGAMSEWWTCIHEAPPTTEAPVTTPPPAGDIPSSLVVVDLLIVGIPACLDYLPNVVCVDDKRQQAVLDAVGRSAEVAPVSLYVRVSQVEYLEGADNSNRPGYPGASTMVEVTVSYLTDEDAIQGLVKLTTNVANDQLPGDIRDQFYLLAKSSRRADYRNVTVSLYSQDSITAYSANGTKLDAGPMQFPFYRTLGNGQDPVDNCGAPNGLDASCNTNSDCMPGLFCASWAGQTCRPCQECLYNGPAQSDLDPEDSQSQTSPFPDTTCWAQNNCPGTPICPNGSYHGFKCPSGCPAVYSIIFMPEQCLERVPDSLVDPILKKRSIIGDCSLSDKPLIVMAILIVLFMILFLFCLGIMFFFNQAEEEIRESKMCVRDGLYVGP